MAAPVLKTPNSIDLSKKEKNHLKKNQNLIAKIDFPNQRHAAGAQKLQYKWGVILNRYNSTKKSQIRNLMVKL